ncbi:MAG: hypothetical protein ABMA26_03845, partial [Limisphaerales bacterium]
MRASSTEETQGEGKTMGATHTIHRARILISTMLSAACGGARLLLPPPNRILLLLLAACALCATPAARAADPLPLPAPYFDTVQPVVPVGTPFAAWLLTDNYPATHGALYEISWDANGTTHSGEPAQGTHYLTGEFQSDAPGVFTFTGRATWNFETGSTTGTATSSTAVVAVTNVLAIEDKALVGPTRVGLTAQMTPVDAWEFVYWSLSSSNGGGSLSTNQGMGTTFTETGAGEFTIKATCGSSSASRVIRIPGVVAVAGPGLVAVNDDYEFTATISYGPAQMALTWTAQDGAVISQTNNTATIRFSSPGTKNVTAQLGTTSAFTNTTAVHGFGSPAFPADAASTLDLTKAPVIGQDR